MAAHYGHKLQQRMFEILIKHAKIIDELEN